MDGLEAELAGTLIVLRVDIFSPAGRELGERFGARMTPTFVLLDGTGVEIYRQLGTLDAAVVRSRISGP